MIERLPPQDQTDFFARALAFELSLGSVALVLGWLLGFNPLANLLPQPADLWSISILSLWGIAGAVPMIAALAILNRYPIGPFKGLKDLTERLVIPLFSTLGIWQIGLLSLAAGIGEELLFRGFLQAGLAHWLPLAHDEWLACLMASIMFGLCHWLSSTYGVIAIVVGLYLGGLFLFTGSLLPPMLTHAIYDFIALVYFVRSSTGKVQAT